ncbi:MAG: MBL fold metallo-hydrolase [Eubacterium sp.]|nr:MBL fold metallo-hydrolase [Eubacterium sp.]
MKITYIYHSCFLVETADRYYLFDYYKGTLPELDTERPILVFASHRHEDHYNPEIFAILSDRGMKKVYAILPNDIPAKRYPRTDAEIIKVYHSQEYVLPGGIRLETLLSTDRGVAFLLQCREGTIYHAGDLNDWGMETDTEQERKQMQGSYRAQINRLKGRTLDAAFLPLDSRLGSTYAQGILYFLQTVNVKKVYPMHYWEQPEVIDRFLAEYPQYKDILQNTPDHSFPISSD